MLNRPLLERVAEWLEAGAPHEKMRGMKFDMGPVVRIDVDQLGNENWCGTACCMVGAALTIEQPDVVPPTLEWLMSAPYNVPRGEYSLNLWQDAVNVTGVDAWEANLLFGPHEMEIEDIETPEDLQSLIADYPDNDWNGLIVDDWPYASHQIDAAWAARVLRDFLATGRIRWDLHRHVAS